MVDVTPRQPNHIHVVDRPTRHNMRSVHHDPYGDDEKGESRGRPGNKGRWRSHHTTRSVQASVSGITASLV